MNNLSFDIRIVADGKTIVDIHDFSLERDRVTFLLGESGIGKSLIARAVYGLLDPSELTVRINGRPYAEYVHSREVLEIQQNGFFVFQEPSSHLNPLMTLRDQMREGSFAKGPENMEVLRALWEGSPEIEVDRILGVYPKPYRPSGGEKQRVLLAMALEKIDMLPAVAEHAAETLFVFDEPSGSLDNHYRDLFLSHLFERFRHRSFTALVITHDYSMISRILASGKDILDSVSFRELARDQGGLALREFQPGTYTGWIEGLRRSPLHTPTGPEPPAVLIVEDSLEVFGRRLRITRDAAGLEPVPLTVSPGTMVYVKAPSGTGKTTLVKRVMGLIAGGKIRATIKGTQVTSATPRSFWQDHVWGKSMTMVFQHADEALNLHSKMQETLAGLPTRRPLTPAAIVALAGELFDADEIKEILTKRVRLLSGGQKQRLNLLRGLALDTDILILDEPLNGLDFDSCTRVIGMLRRKMDAGVGLLVISHNEELFDALAGTNIYYLQYV